MATGNMYGRILAKLSFMVLVSKLWYSGAELENDNFEVLRGQGHIKGHRKEKT